MCPSSAQRNRKKALGAGSAQHDRTAGISGILLLDKPTGMSSHDALLRAQNLLHAKKIGHAGTLDPLATGVLPLALGEATKACNYLLESDKGYVATATLGIRTNTGDSTGEIVEVSPLPALNPELIESVLQKFRGTSEQIPPMHSALKQGGEKLYLLARAGVEVVRAARPITIHRLVLKGYTEHTLELEIDCSKGTYIRTLIEAIGTELGCGAHVSALRRTWVAPFQGLAMVTLDELAQLEPRARWAKLAPTEAALAHFTATQLDADQEAYFLCGVLLNIKQAPGLCCVSGPSGLLGVGEVDACGALRVVRGIRVAKAALG